MNKIVLKISFVFSMFKYQLSNKTKRTYYYILQTNSTHFDKRIIFKGFLTLCNPIFLPTAYSPALVLGGKEVSGLLVIILQF
jgi:hypothetical protein